MKKRMKIGQRVFIYEIGYANIARYTESGDVVVERRDPPVMRGDKPVEGTLRRWTFPPEVVAPFRVG